MQVCFSIYFCTGDSKVTALQAGVMPGHDSYSINLVPIPIPENFKGSKGAKDDPERFSPGNKYMKRRKHLKIEC